MHRFPQRFALAAALLAAALWACACAVPLGPGYKVEKQRINVRFEATDSPNLFVESEYRLKNDGNQPITALEVRLPGKSIHTANMVASWNSASLSLRKSGSNSRDTSLQLPQPWNVGARRTLRISYEIKDPEESEQGLRFAQDAFFLPQGGWSPELLSPHGFLGKGGTPPDKWFLAVTVPREFHVRMSGEHPKRSHKDNETTVRSRQRATDGYPFVVAGEYTETEVNQGSVKVYLWTRAKPATETLRKGGAGLVRALEAYDSAFGVRGKEHLPLWIVECPVQEGCLTWRNAPYAKLLGLPQDTATAEMISLDTVLVSQQESKKDIAVAAAPFLAASWLGYVRNPDFFEQQPPLSALPIYAAALGREAVEGKSAQEEMIRDALSEIPEQSPKGAKEGAETIRAKGFLFFYALRDRYGEQAFRMAIQHMLYARQGRGFDLDDLISALEQETHENVAQFVRLWMKHPGVPEDFRERYAEKAAANNSEENAP